MLIIRLRVKREVQALISDAARENNVGPDYARDLFALFYLNGNGIPDKSRVPKMARALAKRTNTSELASSITINQRRGELLTIAASAPFAGFVAMKKNARNQIFPLFRRLLSSIVMLALKAQGAQCITCKLLPNCDFGKQYSGRVRDIRKVLDPDFSKKVHADCPHRPDLGMTNLINTALNAIHESMSEENSAESTVAGRKSQQYQGYGVPPEENASTQEVNALKTPAEPDLQFDNSAEDFDEEPPDFVPPSTIGGHGQGDGRYNTTHTGGNIIPPDDAIKKLSVSQLAIFQLGQVFDRLLAKDKKGKFSPSPITEPDRQNREMKSPSEIIKAVPSSHALPEEIRNAKIERKKLEIRENVSPEEKKKILYLLIDSSGSMSTWLNAAANSATADYVLTRSELSMVLTLSLLKRVERDKGIVYIRFFESSVSRLLAANDAASFEQARKMVSHAGFNGGGTNITGALTHAAQDIARANSGDTLHEAEILLITDAEDSMYEKNLRDAVLNCGPNVKEFNVLDVSGRPMPSDEEAKKPHNATNAALVLKTVATKYFKASGQTLDPAKIIALI